VKIPHTVARLILGCCYEVSNGTNYGKLACGGGRIWIMTKFIVTLLLALSLVAISHAANFEVELEHPDVESALKKLKPNTQKILREFLAVQKEIQTNKALLAQKNLKQEETTTLKAAVDVSEKRLAVLKESLAKFDESDLLEMLLMIGDIKDPYNLAEGILKNSEGTDAASVAQRDAIKKFLQNQSIDAKSLLDLEDFLDTAHVAAQERETRENKVASGSASKEAAEHTRGSLPSKATKGVKVKKSEN
jgi:hypothetical protein